MKKYDRKNLGFRDTKEIVKATNPAEERRNGVNSKRKAMQKECKMKGMKFNICKRIEPTGTRKNITRSVRGPIRRQTTDQVTGRWIA